MGGQRQIQVSELLAHLAGEYFARESNRESLMTITRAELAPNLKFVKIFFSVLPESFEDTVLAFAKRSRSEFRKYVREHSALHPIPTRKEPPAHRRFNEGRQIMVYWPSLAWW